MCYDTDVFEYSNSPKIDFAQLSKCLQKVGANEVHCIKAKRCIEDWFLIDKTGICRFLGINDNCSLRGINGIKKMENLFNKSDKVYVKGEKTEGLIQALDIEKIISEKQKSFKPLFKVLGIIDYD